jgi:hypothetical protein
MAHAASWRSAGKNKSHVTRSTALQGLWPRVCGRISCRASLRLRLQALPSLLRRCRSHGLPAAYRPWLVLHCAIAVPHLNDMGTRAAEHIPHTLFVVVLRFLGWKCTCSFAWRDHDKYEIRQPVTCQPVRRPGRMCSKTWRLMYSTLYSSTCMKDEALMSAGGAAVTSLLRLWLPPPCMQVTSCPYKAASDLHGGLYVFGSRL